MTRTPASRTRLSRPFIAVALVSLFAIPTPLIGQAASAVTVPAADVAVATGLPYQDPSLSVPERVEDLLSRMSLDDKLGQMTQVERNVLADQTDLATYRIGSILSGGGSAPTPNTATAWADMYDSFQRTATSSNLGIPIIYGIDGVHGHNNVQGATIFPHNIGLGATRDPELVQRIGRAVAEEVSGTGIDWDFAPCLCVARDDRWGRTYESFGEVPEIPASMATFVTGMQGENLNDPGSVLATAKHWIGDGGTTGGDDQGNTQISEQELREIHMPPFQAALDRGVGSVMISYSSWDGVKMHSNAYLINDVLKRELGFTGFVVSDWQGIDQIDGQGGFTADEIRISINVGIDMIMVPSDYKLFLQLLKQEVDAGRITRDRVDDANRRILTKKFELGLFENPYTDRAYTDTVGNAEHREIAREAVRESQVLLKNKWNVLPLPKTSDKVFVAGKSADNIGYQSGGWTIEWQGASGPITPGTTILQGIRDTVSDDTTVTFNEAGDGIDSSYKAAIAVIGETPYTEFMGDRPDGLSLDATDLATLAKLKASGVPVIVVLVSGRPLDIAGELDGWDALVASWLPGTEGQGVADVLFGDYAPTGKLPSTWMRSFDQQPINAGDGKDSLFPLGFGLSYPDSQDAREIIGAAYFDAQQGTRVEACTDLQCGQNVGYIADGDRLQYDQVNFGNTSPTRIQVRVASGAWTRGRIEVHLDSPDGPTVATVPVTRTGGWQNWQTVTAALTTPTTGSRNVHLVFRSDASTEFININWFRFEQ